MAMSVNTHLTILIVSQVHNNCLPPKRAMTKPTDESLMAWDTASIRLVQWKVLLERKLNKVSYQLKMANICCFVQMFVKIKQNKENSDSLNITDTIFTNVEMNKMLWLYFNFNQITYKLNPAYCQSLNFSICQSANMSICQSGFLKNYRTDH